MMFIVPVATVFLIQVITVTWIAITAPEPCPKKYLDMGGDVVKYCEVTSAGVGSAWSLIKGNG